jgi:hypothetical protein
MRPVESQAKALLKEGKEEEEEKSGKLGVQQYMMFDAEESEEEEVKHQQWTPYESKKVYKFSAQAHEEEKVIQ